MGVIEDTITAVPDERAYVGFISVAAGLYAMYTATHMPFPTLTAFGFVVVVFGILQFTPHSHLIDSLFEPMLAASGVIMILPYVQMRLSGAMQYKAGTVALVVFGVLLLVTSLISLVYEE